MRNRTRLMTAALTACLLTATFGTFAQPARATGHVYFVSPTGSDYEADGYTTRANSETSPWRTMLQSIRRLRPGDTLNVRGGTYTEWSIGWGAVRGTSSAPIKVMAYNGERVVLKGTMQLLHPDYWTIQGINVTRDPAHSRSEFLVKIVGGTHWQLLNSEIWGNRGVSNVLITSSSADGVPRNYRVAYNCIHDNDTTGDPSMNDHNIYLYPGYSSGPGTIDHNIIFNAENGGNIKAGGPSSSTGASYVSIHHNTMVHAATGIIVGYGTHHISMVRNLIGQRVGGPASFNGAYVGNHVSGVSDNVGYAGVFGVGTAILNTKDSKTGIKNTGHVVWVTPSFDTSTLCSGFHPANATAKGYGRYAP